jgi:hypothetical protein
MLDNFQKLVQKLKNPSINQSIMVGFDGYVDNLYGVVQKKSGTQKHHFPDIASFSKHIANLAGKSGQVELALKATKIGGNAPIMSQALGELGFKVHCLGTLGYPQLHPVFQSFHPNVYPHTLAMPGLSDAFEFDDGKLIFSDCGSFDALGWEKVKENLGLEKIQEIYLQSQIIATVDWVNLPYATDIWQGLLKEVVHPNGKLSKKFMFDLADPSRKSNAEIREALEVISSFCEYGEVALGLNENETNLVFTALYEDDFANHTLEDKALRIFQSIGIDSLVIHPVDRSFAISKAGLVSQKGKIVQHPKILTGGGDNFNAGFVLGWYLELETEEKLLLGMACSGAYILNAKSPGISEIIEYLKLW